MAIDRLQALLLTATSFISNLARNEAGELSFQAASCCRVRIKKKRGGYYDQLHHKDLKKVSMISYYSDNTSRHFCTNSDNTSYFTLIQPSYYD